MRLADLEVQRTLVDQCLLGHRRDHHHQDDHQSPGGRGIRLFPLHLEQDTHGITQVTLTDPVGYMGWWGEGGREAVDQTG